jgi:hypothetical protein
MTPFQHTKAQKSDVLHSDQLEKPADLLPTTDPTDNAEVPAGYFPVTVEEKAMSSALNVKFDIFLLPFMSLLYLFNGLDRGNVGNAQTQGLNPPWLIGIKLTSFQASPMISELNPVISISQCHYSLSHLFSSSLYPQPLAAKSVPKIGFQSSRYEEHLAIRVLILKPSPVRLGCSHHLSCFHSWAW